MIKTLQSDKLYKKYLSDKCIWGTYQKERAEITTSVQAVITIRSELNKKNATNSEENASKLLEMLPLWENIITTTVVNLW